MVVFLSYPKKLYLHWAWGSLAAASGLAVLSTGLLRHAPAV